MILRELFVNHPYIAWSLVAIVAVEFIAVVVLVMRLFRNPKPRRGAGY